MNLLEVQWGVTGSLTSAADNIQGSVGNDTISGILQADGGTGTTIAPGDAITAGDGTDTLTISVAGDIVASADYTLSAISTTGLEKVFLSNFDTDATYKDIVDTSLMTGLTHVGLLASNATGDTEFSNLKNLVTGEMRNGSGDLTLTYNTSVLAGTADTQNLTVSALTGGTFTVSGAETVAINSEVASSTLAAVSATGMTKLVVTGDSALKITGSLTNKTTDASAFTSGLTAVFGNATQSVTGGTGNDVLDFGANLTKDDTVAAGTGTDTLKLSVGAATIDATATTGELINVTGFEMIDIASTDDGAALDLNGFTGATNVIAAANQYTLAMAGTNEVTLDTLTFTLNGTTYTTGAIDTGNAAKDTVEEVLATKIGEISGFSATAGADTVTITATTGEAVEIGTFVANDNSGGGAFSVSSAGTTGYNNATFSNLAAGVAVDIYSGDAITANLKDGSGSADALSVNLKTTTADRGFNHTVGSFTTTLVETVNLDVSGMADFKTTTLTTLSATGATTLNVTGDSDLTIGTLTASVLTAVNASTSTGDIGLTISTTKDQSITTGSGNDTIAMATFLTAADTIDGGANTTTSAGPTGKDVLTATINGLTATTGALKVSNVENIYLNTSGSASTVDATSISGAESISVTGALGVTLTNLAADAKVGLGNDGATTTTNYTGTLTASLKDATGTADSLTISMTDTDGSSAATIATDGIETVVFAAGTSTSYTTNAINNSLTLTNLKASTIQATGGNTSVTGTLALGTLNATVNKVDVSALTTASGAIVSGSLANATTGVTIDGVTKGKNSFTGSSLGDTINIGGNFDEFDVIVGGGGTDTLNATVDSTSSGLGGTLDFSGVSDVEIINLTIASGAAASLDNVGTASTSGLNDAEVTKVTINGGNVLSSFTNGTVALGGSGISTIDASAFNGNVSLLLTATAMGTGKTVKAGAATTDAIAVTAVSSSLGAATISGVETITITTSTGDSGAIDMSNTTGASTVNVLGAQSFAISNLAAGVKVGLGNTATKFEGGKTLTVGLASSASTTDALTMNVGKTNTTSAVAALSVSGVETMTLDFGTLAEDHYLDLTNISNSTNKTKLVMDKGVAASAVTFTNNATLASGTGGLSADITQIDASTFVGNMVMNDASRTGTTAMTITGGSGADTVIMKNTADVLEGNTGTDTLKIVANQILGGVEVNLASTTDQVSTFNGSSNATVQKGFENVDLSGITGTFGSQVTAISTGSTVVGTSNGDVITGGAGADSISGGSGNDAISSGAAADTIVGGAGADNITLGGADSARDVVKFTSTSAANLALEGGDTVTDFQTAATRDIINFATGALANGANTGYANLTATNGTIGTNDVVVTLGGTNFTSTGDLSVNATALAIADALDTSNVTNGDKVVILLDNGTNTYAWLFAETATNAGTIDTAEFSLLAVLSSVADAGSFSGQAAAITTVGLAAATDFFSIA